MKTYAILAAFTATLFSTSAFAATAGKLEVASMQTPQFPSALVQRGILAGETEVIVSVDPSGKVVDWLITAHTDPAFEQPTREILETLSYKPLSSDGRQQAPIRVTVNFLFETRGAIISHSINDTMELLTSRFKFPSRIEKLGTLRELDQTPVARRQVSPRFASAASAKAGTRVTIEFLIDEAGRVRMPVLHEAADWQLAEAAANALLEWQFEPPTRKGQPVIVAARQEFIFNPAP